MCGLPAYVLIQFRRGDGLFITGQKVHNFARRERGAAGSRGSGALPGTFADTSTGIDGRGIGAAEREGGEGLAQGTRGGCRGSGGAGAPGAAGGGGGHPTQNFI